MKFFILPLLIIITGHVYAQDSISNRRAPDTVRLQKDFSLVTGLHFGKYIYAEVGLARTWLSTSHHGMGGAAAGISCEVQIGKDILVAPKLSFSVAGASATIAEVNVLYYTDFKNGTFVFRPAAGFGLPHVRLLYGYNVRFGDKRMTGISSNVVSIIALPLSFAKSETRTPR